MTRRTPSSNRRAPVAVRAVYSPRLWPAQKLGSMPRRSAASRTIRLDTNVVSWALRVSRSSSASASRSSLPTSRSAISLASPTSSQLSWSSHGRPIPGRCDPCPGNVKASIVPTVDGRPHGSRPYSPVGRQSGCDRARDQVNCCVLPGWRNWQTRWSQTPLLERACGFKSRPGHERFTHLRPTVRRSEARTARCLVRQPRQNSDTRRDSPADVRARRVDVVSCRRLPSSGARRSQALLGGNCVSNQRCVGSCLQPAQHADHSHDGANHQDPPAHRA